MSNLSLKGFFLLLLVLMITSCGKETVDTTPPTMDNASYSPEPRPDNICGAQEATVFHLSNKGELTFDIVFNDNEALSQYKVDIHNNFDCHGHGGGSAPKIPIVKVDNQTTDWALLDIQSLSGTSSRIQRTLTVPDNVTAGNYHFHIQVIDESGNDSPFANFNSIIIKNNRDTIAPEITLQQPAASSFSIKKGEEIRFAGKVRDNRSLSDGGNGILYLSYTDLTSGNSFSTGKAFSFNETEGSEYDFDFTYQVPKTLVSRKYRFSLGANDGVRNVAPFVYFDVDVE